MAKAMLSKIFAVEDEESEDDIKESVLLKRSSKTATEHHSNALVNNHSSGNEAVINGLDRSHSQLYQELISAEVWQREAVNELCESLNLMINGAIETINDWAYDKVDAPVLEDDDEVVVDFEIVDELKALNS